MRNLSMLAAFILFVLSAYPQQLYFNHLSVNNGLTQGVNNCIFKDSKGFVWISSFDGLNRFDGMDCKKYYASSDGQGGIRGTLFLNILEDKQANLWIGSNEGLNFYNRLLDSFYCFRIGTAGSGEQFCSPFYIDHRNRTWLQSGHDIFIFDPADNKFTQVSGKISNGRLIIKTIPEQLYKPLQQLLVVSSNSPVLRRGSLSGDHITWRTDTLPLGETSINAMVLSGHNNCWLGTGDGLYRISFNPSIPICKKIKAPLQISVSSLHLDKAGTLWIGTLKHGLLKADTAANILQQYLSQPDNSYSISGNQIIYIYTDDDANLWTAVWGKGIDYTNLDKFHFNQYVSKTAAQHFDADNFIRSLVCVSNEIWCATQSGGLLVLDSSKKIKQAVQEGLPPSVEHLYAAGHTVWAATFKGLFRVDAATKIATKIIFANDPYINVAASQFNYISPLPNGDLLLSSNAGLYIMRKQGSSYRQVTVKGAEASDVYLTTYADGNGLLYISKAFKGFGIYRLMNDSLHLVKHFPLQATIKCFTNTADSLLWMGSTVGLIRFNRIVLQISKIYTTAEGLSNQYVYGVVNDGAYLWLSTNAGINRFHPTGPVVTTFSAADGLQSNEYNTYSFCKTPNGEILFGGVNGLNGFYPASLKPFNTAPRLVLSSVWLNDVLFHPPVNYTALSALGVSYRQNTLSFQFTVIDYVNAAAAHIRYMLDGFDKGWVQADSKSLIRYVNLPPGKYTLKVKAFNAGGVMAKETYALPVNVQAPWWQSWWFRLLLVLTIAAIAVSIIRTYLQRKLHKQRTTMEKELAIEQERNRMARELHDGMGSMLSGIKHSFSAIKGELPLSQRQHAGFENNIQKLDASIRELRTIAHSMASAGLLEGGLETALNNYCSSMGQPGGLKINFQALRLQQLCLREDLSFHVLRIVQELTHNIVKHAGASQAIVQVSHNNGSLYITVEDNGIGFSNEMQSVKHGLGLKHIAARVKILKGKIDIRTANRQGTSVLIEIPVV